MSLLSFGADARLGSRRDFSAVINRGRKIVGRNLILWVGRRAAPAKGGAAASAAARLGLSVSGKLGNAVVRNRLKRLAREAFRAARPGLAQGSDLVVYLRPGCRWKVLADAQLDFAEACRKAGVAGKA